MLELFIYILSEAGMALQFRIELHYCNCTVKCSVFFLEIFKKLFKTFLKFIIVVGLQAMQ